MLLFAFDVDVPDIVFVQHSSQSVELCGPGLWQRLLVTSNESSSFLCV